MRTDQAYMTFTRTKETIIAAGMLLYLHISLLQQENNHLLLSSILLANADSGGNQTGGESGTTGAGNAGAGRTSGDEGDEISNPGADLVKNTGDDIRISDFEGVGIPGAPKTDPDASSKENMHAADATAMSPGGTGEDRVIGGDTNREIDWNDIVDKGTGEADAATG